jgi:hypothetical protein
VEALRKKERQDKTHFTTKIDGFHPHWMLMYFSAGFFESHRVYDQTRDCGAVFVLLYG